MQTTYNINTLIYEISKLDTGKKFAIVESILKMIKHNESKNNQIQPPRLDMLKGLGAEIWKDINIIQYIHNERQWD